MSIPIIEYLFITVSVMDIMITLPSFNKIYSFKPKHLLDDVTMGYAHVVCNESDEVL
jgi:hypothetical protein